VREDAAFVLGSTRVTPRPYAIATSLTAQHAVVTWFQTEDAISVQTLSMKGEPDPDPHVIQAEGNGLDAWLDAWLDVAIDGAGEVALVRVEPHVHGPGQHTGRSILSGEARW